MTHPWFTTAAVVVTALLIAVVGVWAWKVHLSPDAKARRAEAMAATASLREAVLSRQMLLQAPPDSTAQRVFAMDWQVSAGQLATLVSFEDGTTSIYFSSGGGVIGTGAVPTVKPVAAKFRTAFTGLEPHFRVVNAWPPPAPGNCVFYYIDRDATRATRPVSEGELRIGSHALSGLAADAQSLITAIRTAQPILERENDRSGT